MTTDDQKNSEASSENLDKQPVNDTPQNEVKNNEVDYQKQLENVKKVDKLKQAEYNIEQERKKRLEAERKAKELEAMLSGQDDDNDNESENIERIVEKTVKKVLGVTQESQTDKLLDQESGGNSAKKELLKHYIDNVIRPDLSPEDKINLAKKLINDRQSEFKENLKSGIEKSNDNASGGSFNNHDGLNDETNANQMNYSQKDLELIKRYGVDPSKLNQ